MNVFVQRGIEAVGFSGEGLIVIADDDRLMWTKEVLASVQRFASDRGFYVSRMMPRLHAYHLDDAPDLKSCNLVIKSVLENTGSSSSVAITDESRLLHFYGLGQAPRVRYVRERKRLDYGKASDEEYELEMIGDLDA